MGKQCGLKVDHRFLGRIMSSLWGGKVKRPVRLGEPVFADLRRRGEVSEPDLPAIMFLDGRLAEMDNMCLL